MSNGSTFFPVAGVEVRVEVGSNCSLELAMNECKDCNTHFMNSHIIERVAEVQWNDIESIDLKSIVSCINV